MLPIRHKMGFYGCAAPTTRSFAACWFQTGWAKLAVAGGHPMATPASQAGIPPPQTTDPVPGRASRAEDPSTSIQQPSSPGCWPSGSSRGVLAGGQDATGSCWPSRLAFKVPFTRILRYFSAYQLPPNPFWPLLPPLKALMTR